VECPSYGRSRAVPAPSTPPRAHRGIRTPTPFGPRSERGGYASSPRRASCSCSSGSPCQADASPPTGPGRHRNPCACASCTTGNPSTDAAMSWPPATSSKRFAEAAHASRPRGVGGVTFGCVPPRRSQRSASPLPVQSGGVEPPLDRLSSWRLCLWATTAWGDAGESNSDHVGHIHVLYR
jgi:hypothetical protein